MKHLPRLTLLSFCLIDIAHGAISGLNVVPTLPEVGVQASPASMEDDPFSSGGFWNDVPGYQWKGFLLHGNLNYRSFYTDNPLTAVGSRKDDYMHYVSPLIQVTRGIETESRSTLFDISYQPTFVFSSLGNADNRTYQLLRGNITHTWDDKTITLNHQYQQSSEASSQTSYISPQENNQTTAGFRTPLTGKITADVSFQQNLTSSKGAGTSSNQDLSSWMGTFFALYDLLPKLTSGLGVSTGYSEQSSKSSQYRYLTERILTSWNYHLTGKIVLDLQAGAQIAQSHSASTRDPDVAPAITAHISYQPRYGTQLGVGTGIDAGASLFYSAQFLTQSSADLFVRQRIFESFAGTFRIGYVDGSYENLRPGGAVANRNYTGVSFSTELEWRINIRLRAALFHQYLSRSSQTGVDSFSANQVGINCNIAF